MSTPNHFDLDDHGRTSLHRAAEAGELELVKEILFSLTGTGIFPQRLALLEIKDESGLTAIDLAEQAGHEEIAQLLNGEFYRMSYFE